ncbi:Mitochondrial transcription termination factor family protein, partial [Prunus dulcis]
RRLRLLSKRKKESETEPFGNKNIVRQTLNQKAAAAWNLIEMLMTRLQKLTTASVLKWVSSSFAENHLRLSRTPLKPIFPNAQTLRLYSSRRGLETENSVNLENTLTSNGENAARISRVIIKEAQAALLDYLHCTRGLQFMDAENMSKNSPHFLEKLLRRVDNENEDEVGWSIARYLRYHPINEFEPFFESLGLKPSEYVPYLPRSLMFLTDDGLLLHNYTVLCRYGIARNKIGKIYKEAIEVFQYDFEVLPSKLQAYEELGISQSALIKFIVASPYLLIGDVNAAFVEVLEILKSSGFETCWIEENLLEEHSYNWSRMLEVLHWFSEKGCSDEQLGIEMEVAEIGKIIRSHPLLLGSIAIKKTNTLLTGLNVGKKRLSRYIQENPEELKNLVLGRRVEPLPAAKEDQKSKAQKLEFLLDKGFVENSNKMKAALKVFRGKGTELKERFDCIVNAGLDRKDVCKMIEVSPQILNLKKGVIEKKIDFLVNHLGHPVSSLASFPSYLSYRTERVKFRVYVNHHPTGPQVWKDFKSDMAHKNKHRQNRIKTSNFEILGHDLPKKNSSQETDRKQMKG